MRSHFENRAGVRAFIYNCDKFEIYEHLLCVHVTHIRTINDDSDTEYRIKLYLIWI